MIIKFREIEFTKYLGLYKPSIQYYYMGYYLFDCPKMSYKGKFRPSDLLCDKTFKWVIFLINYLKLLGASFRVLKNIGKK